MIGTDEDIERRLQEQLEGPKAMFSAEERVSSSLFDVNRQLTIQWIPEQEQLPHVFTAVSNVPGIAMSQGGKFALPAGTTREINDVS
jgi:antiviral helicase SLH1